MCVELNQIVCLIDCFIDMHSLRMDNKPQTLYGQCSYTLIFQFNINNKFYILEEIV